MEKFIGEGGGVRPQIEIVKDQTHGIELAKRILYTECNPETALFLSGGETPKPLYEILAQEGRLNVAAAAMVDERLTPDFYDRNETMIRESGLVSYLGGKGKTFYPIYPDFTLGKRTTLLQINLKRPSLVQMREEYDSVLKKLLSKYKGIAVLGLGSDGHTASLPAGGQGVLEEAKLNSPRYVEGYDDFPVKPRERITLTPKALSEMRLLVLIAFGEKKRKALEAMLKSGPISRVPARFLATESIARNTIVITDQPIKAPN